MVESFSARTRCVAVRSALLLGITSVTVMAAMMAPGRLLAAPASTAAAHNACMQQTAAALADTSVKQIFGNVELRGCATDDASGIEGVDVTWQAQGSDKRGDICIHPENPENWVCSWDTTHVDPGLYVVTVTATDNAGNSGSYDRRFEVVAPPPEVETDSTPPVVGAPVPAKEEPAESDPDVTVEPSPSTESPDADDGIENPDAAIDDPDEGADPSSGIDSGASGTSEGASEIAPAVDDAGMSTEGDDPSQADEQSQAAEASLADLAGFLLENLPAEATIELSEPGSVPDGRPGLLIRLTGNTEQAASTADPVDTVDAGKMLADKLGIGIGELATSASIDVRVLNADDGIFISLPDQAALDALLALIPPDHMADATAIADATVLQE